MDRRLVFACIAVAGAVLAACHTGGHESSGLVPRGLADAAGSDASADARLGRALDGSAERGDAGGREPGAAPPAPGQREAPTVALPDGFSAAPAFEGTIRYVARAGNVMLYLPEVVGAGDYRVYALTPDVKLDRDGEAGQRVTGAVIACAGLKQHNQCDQSEAMTSFGPNLRVPNCAEDVRAVSVPKRLARQLQLDGLSGKTTVVVEAIDALCPFPGAYGARHHEFGCFYDGQPIQAATHNGQSVQWRMCPASFPVRTEAEIRADYGSLILNGQAPAPAPAAGSPWESIGLPAPSRAPQVLARTAIEVEPLAPSALPEEFSSSDFFESFSDPGDAPRRVEDAHILPANFPVINPTLFQTSKLSLYSYGADDPQWFLAHGTLRTVLADWEQQIMGSNVMYPRRAFALPADDAQFLHVTFEVPANASQRRYWWLHACGAAEPAQTVVGGKLAPEAGIVAEPGFMNPLEGTAISPKGWNCIQVVPRGGSYETLPGGPYRNGATGGGRPESDLRIVINRPLANVSDPRQTTGSISNVSPAMVPDTDPVIEGGWMREWDAHKTIRGVLLDEQLYAEQRVKFDVYFNRGRLVLYADGVQKLCNDYPAQRLTMAEAAIGLGHVLYHSSAEREDFLREDWIRTGQFHYLHNLPFVDQRSFDNFGVREQARLPAGFVEGQCYRAGP